MGEPLIYAAICGVMEDVGAVGKNYLNKQQGFMYRSVDAVMNALNPAMRKHKVFCVPEVLEQAREERTTAKGGLLIYSTCRVQYTFFAMDGSCVRATVIGEGMDSGDKASNKAMAVAFKYACFQVFCIPTENLVDDPDAGTPQPCSKDGAPVGDGGKANGRTSGVEGRQRDPKWVELKELVSKELERTGYSWNAVAKTYKVSSVEGMTALQLKDCLAKTKKLPSKDLSVEEAG